MPILKEGREKQGQVLFNRDIDQLCPSFRAFWWITKLPISSLSLKFRDFIFTLRSVDLLPFYWMTNASTFCWTER
jgi:hypothetical protein